MTLKTLKDIIEEQSGGTRVYPMSAKEKIPNTDDKIYFDAIEIIEKRIREEAKEWITHLWGKVGLVAVKGKRENVIPVNEMMKLNAQIDWINMFFNLEEDDR